ncbi:hypothetical protein Btru_071529 [Bulinus truncatus]|nr:hypothetical protein Btru_071529 [Bulinus truncatus]
MAVAVWRKWGTMTVAVWRKWGTMTVAVWRKWGTMTVAVWRKWGTMTVAVWRKWGTMTVAVWRKWGTMTVAVWRKWGTMTVAVWRKLDTKTVAVWRKRNNKGLGKEAKTKKYSVTMEITNEVILSDRPPSCNNGSQQLGNCTGYNISMPQVMDALTPEAVIVPCVFALILIVGLIGNLLLILSFSQHKTMTTTHNVLVVNLAAGDFIFLIVSLPFNSLWYTVPYWPFGLVICKLSYFAESLATAVVITTLSVLSVERCLIVTGKRLWRQKRREPILLTVSIWAIAMVVSVPTLMSSVLNNEMTEKPLCHMYDTNWGKLYPKIHVLLRFVLLFCLPLLVIAVAYTVIAIHLLLRAFPLSDRRRAGIKSNAQNPSQCLNNKASSFRENEANSPKTRHEANHKSDSKFTTAQSKDGDDRKSKECLLPPNSQSRIQSCESIQKSPKVSNESNQATPVYPNSYVYTGPIPTMDVPYLRKTSSSAQTAGATDGCTDSHGASFKPLKETTPLNTEVRLEGTKLTTPAPPPQPSRPQSMVVKRRRLALTVLMLIMAFAVCWTPRHIYFLWFYFYPEEDFNDFWHIFKIAGFCLSFSNSAVNPLVFYKLDTKYRSYVNSLLCALCWKCCGHGPAPGSDAVITLGERDYNATVAPTKSKESVTQL